MTIKHTLLLSASLLVSFILLLIPVSSLYYDPSIYHGQGYTLVMTQGGGSLPTEHSVTLFKSPYVYMPSTEWHYVAMTLNYLNMILVLVAAGSKNRRTSLVFTYSAAAGWFALAAMIMFVPFVDVRELSASPLSYFGVGGQAMLDNAESRPSYIALALALTALGGIIVAANDLKRGPETPDQESVAPEDPN